MRAATTLAIGILTLVSACGGPTRTAAAKTTFERFQDALFAADATAMRKLVTAESAPAIDEMPWERVRTRQRLVAVDAADMRGCYHVTVLDPNADNAPGTYVVVRENGRMVVDLVATAALCGTITGYSAGPTDLEPRALTAEDHDEIRRHELATPPGSPVR